MTTSSFDLNRETADVNVGALGTNAFTPYTSTPTGSATVLVTSYTYDAAGRIQNVTSPNGNVSGATANITRTLYDMAGRVTDTYQNWNATLSPTGSVNVHTGYAYDGDDHVIAEIKGSGVFM
jgi:hypothetical protein